MPTMSPAATAAPWAGGVEESEVSAMAALAINATAATDASNGPPRKRALKGRFDMVHPRFSAIALRDPEDMNEPNGVTGNWTAD